MLRKYRLGFNLFGFLAFMLVMLPNIAWMIFPPENDILQANSSGIPALDICMQASQWLMVGFLTILIPKEKPTGKILLGISAVCLAAYYIMWICYFCGIYSTFTLISMAVLPSAYFICISLRNRNYPALVFAVTFSALHIGITGFNFL